MSANTIVDLGNSADIACNLRVVSGTDDTIGPVIDMLGAAGYTGVWVAGFGATALEVRIQTSDATTSGSFTDPTSGLPVSAFPVGGKIVSGGIFWANSGAYLSGYSSPAAPVAGATLFASGGMDIACFQRPHRYARLWVTSGNASITNVPFQAGFICQKRLTGASGTAGGFSYAPSSGVVSV